MDYPIKAIAVFDGKVKGIVNFIEHANFIEIKINLSGLKKNALHGFHVHESGDLTNKCDSMCAHFNPFGKIHGCPGSVERHVGDLGNIVTNEIGEASYTMYDNVIKLRGTISNIIGRGLVVHQDPDDCGRGNNKESRINGNAGKRIGCAIIGYSKENFTS